MWCAAHWETCERGDEGHGEGTRGGRGGRGGQGGRGGRDGVPHPSEDGPSQTEKKDRSSCCLRSGAMRWSDVQR